MLKGEQEWKQDPILVIADFEKIRNNLLAHICFESLERIQEKFRRSPGKFKFNLIILRII